MRRLPEAYIDNRILNSGLHLPSASLRSSMVLLVFFSRARRFPCLFLRFLGAARGDLAPRSPQKSRCARCSRFVSTVWIAPLTSVQGKKGGAGIIWRVEQSVLFLLYRAGNLLVSRPLTSSCRPRGVFTCGSVHVCLSTRRSRYATIKRTPFSCVTLYRVWRTLDRGIRWR